MERAGCSLGLLARNLFGSIKVTYIVHPLGIYALLPNKMPNYGFPAEILRAQLVAMGVLLAHRVKNGKERLHFRICDTHAS